MKYYERDFYGRIATTKKGNRYKLGNAIGSEIELLEWGVRHRSRISLMDFFLLVGSEQWTIRKDEKEYLATHDIWGWSSADSNWNPSYYKFPRRMNPEVIMYWNSPITITNE